MYGTADKPRPREALAFFIDHQPRTEDFREAVSAGLSQKPRSIPAKFFYNDAGSRLFAQICETPEYYVTRTEIALLRARGPDIAARVGGGALIIEYGSGSALKIRTLLDALDRPAAYVALDISRQHLLTATEAIANDYPDITVGAVCADFFDPLPPLDAVSDAAGRRLGFFPGSTIGNLMPSNAREMLARIRADLGDRGALLIGIDLKKDRARFQSAYNDAAGLTAEFNKNLLRRMRQELGAEVDIDAFRHSAFYNEAEGRVEMHLVAIRPTAITLDGLRHSFGKGDDIHTENSHKFSIDEFRQLAAAAGFEHGTSWTDDDELFSLHLLEAKH